MSDSTTLNKSLSTDITLHYTHTAELSQDTTQDLVSFEHFLAQTVLGSLTLKWIAPCLINDREIHIAYITTNEYLETVNEILNCFALKTECF